MGANLLIVLGHFESLHTWDFWPAVSPKLGSAEMFWRVAYLNGTLVNLSLDARLLLQIVYRLNKKYFENI